MRLARRKIYLIAAIGGGLCLVGVLYWLFRDPAVEFMAYVTDEETHPAVFVALFCVLPLFGFPISAFLVLLGVKFGTVPGMLIMAAGIPVHLILSFFLANSFLRRRVKRLLIKMEYHPPEIPDNRAGWFSFIFMAVPGLSYTLKNYILALSGVSFRCFFLSGFLVQGTMGVPFVIAGDAVAGKSLLLLAAVLVILILIYLVIYKIRKRRTWNTS